jgi:AmiR/NasT family two-component response regulator
MATLAAQLILLIQSSAPPGTVAAELESASDFHHVVHQASGMVAAQLGEPVAEALVRLRAHAFARERPLIDVARDVVDRRLRFVRDGETETS